MTLNDLRREIAALREARPVAEVMSAVMQLLKDRYEDFDADARKEADRIMDGVIALGTASARNHIGTLEDGPDKRALARAIARSDRDHVTAYDLMAVLEGKTSQTACVVSDAVAPFACALQACTDFLFDARRTDNLGKHDVVLHGLFMGLLDEVLTAFHLAQRAFASQAYAHLRTIEEVLDAIDVLVADPAMLDRWLDATAPEDERSIFKEVRQRVGQGLATDDSRKLYAFLSALGPHSQFRSLQARTALELGDGGMKTATVFFLGSPMQVETANVLTVRSAVAMAHHIGQAFAAVLHKEDVDLELGRCRAGLAELVRAHLLPVAAQMRLTADEVQLVLAHRLGPFSE